LNFTHRSAHGGNDDVDVLAYESLAVQELENLKSKYSSVFLEPVYPVDRSDCPL
jgi:hypothetical protein